MQNNGFSYRPVWTPGTQLVAPPKQLGQASGNFWDSPLLNTVLDSWVAATSAYLGWGFGRRNNSWSTFWYVASAVSGFKVLYDLSKLPR